MYQLPLAISRLPNNHKTSRVYNNKYLLHVFLESDGDRLGGSNDLD